MEFLRELTDTELDSVSGGLGVSTAGGGSTSSSSGVAFQNVGLQTISNTPPNVNTAIAIGGTWVAISSGS
jgi:bacteriocin-like protein